MKFPNAKKGISKMFTAEILYIISAILLGIAAIAIAVAVTGSSQDVISNATAGGTAVGGGLLVVLGAIIALVGGIISLVGIVQAAKDEEMFKNALYLMICYFVISLVVSLALSATGFKDYVSSGSTIIELFGAIFVAKGIINLADKLQNAEVAAKGLVYIKLLIAVFVLDIIIKFFVAFTGNKAAQAIALTLAIASLIISVTKYVIYVSLLAKAKKMLDE